MANVIHRTVFLRNNIKNRIELYAKFIFGKRAKIGKQYSRYQVLEGITVSKGPKCPPLYYDEKSHILLIQTEKNPNSVAFLEGDIVVWRNVLYAYFGGSGFSFSNTPYEAIQELISKYLVSKNIEDEKLSEEIVVAALRSRYYKYPPSLLAPVARMYLDHLK